MAALNGHVESAQLLLDLGASVTEVTVEDGTTIDLIGNSEFKHTFCPVSLDSQSIVLQLFVIEQ